MVGDNDFDHIKTSDSPTHEIKVKSRAWSSWCCGQASFHSFIHSFYSFIHSFIHVLGEIANGLIAAASGSYVC